VLAQASSARIAQGERAGEDVRDSGRLEHILSAVALNLLRMNAWLNGTPLTPLGIRPLLASWPKQPNGTPSCAFATGINSVVKADDEGACEGDGG
jgi:hypothetical protein